MKRIVLFKKIKIRNDRTIKRRGADFILAILFPLVGVILAKFAGPPFTVSTPFLFFIPLIGLSAWNGGLMTGIVSSIISSIALNYYFIPPENAFNLSDPLAIIQLLLVTAEGVSVSFFIDIGKRKDKTLDYRRTIRQQDKKILELEEETKNYKKEIRSRDEFLSIASHELKTPLTSMLLQTQTALHNMRNVSLSEFSVEKLLKMLESVESQTRRLSKMINDLLAVSVITTENLNLEYEKTDFNKLVHEVLNDFSTRIEKENYSVSFVEEDKEIVGNWDKLRIEQALSNFVSNAIKYGDHKPIQIKVRKSNRHVEFVIKDEGIGISKQNQQHMFELFRRGVAQTEYKGLGVGLFITDRIISAHGGSIEVASKLGNGTKFTVKLPLNTSKTNKQNP